MRRAITSRCDHELEVVGDVENITDAYTSEFV